MGSSIPVSAAQAGHDPAASSSAASESDRAVVTFDANGGSFAGGETQDRAAVDKGESVKFPVRPTRTGYAFAGWSTDPDGSAETDLTSVTEDICVYARWKDPDDPVFHVEPELAEFTGSSMYIEPSYASGSGEAASVSGSSGAAGSSYAVDSYKDRNAGVTRFVIRLYQKALGRNYDEAGLEYWCRFILTSSSIQQGCLDAAVNGFFHSDEFLGRGLSDSDYVKVLYRTFLDREYDSQGLAHWVQELQSGKSRDEVLDGFAGSDEFSNIMTVILYNLDETGYLNVASYGADGSDGKDDTDAINACIQHLSAAGVNTVFIPSGTYLIESGHNLGKLGIRLESNMRLVMAPNAILKAQPTSDDNYHVLYIRGKNNVTICGGQIQGERYQHPGTIGEDGKGIVVYNSSNVSISDVRISDCWGDGIYLGTPDDGVGSRYVSISGCRVFNNRRNNIAIVEADDVTVSGCELDGANGTDPMFGLVIETNSWDDNVWCERIAVNHTTFSDNRKAAMGIMLHGRDVTINGCTMNGNGPDYTFVVMFSANITMANTTINGTPRTLSGYSTSGAVPFFY